MYNSIGVGGLNVWFYGRDDNAATNILNEGLRLLSA